MFTHVSIAAGLLLQAAAMPSPPWMSTHFLAPPGTQTAQHSCDAGVVRASIRSQGMTGPPRIERLSIGGRSVSHRRLATLNERLTSLGFYSSYTVACRGPWVAVNLAGNIWDEGVGRGVPGQIGAVLGEGRMWLTDSREDASDEVD